MPISGSIPVTSPLKDIPLLCPELNPSISAYRPTVFVFVAVRVHPDKKKLLSFAACSSDSLLSVVNLLVCFTAEFTANSGQADLN